jgi:putative component of membrane protein insertase Oxa1/YidC/SpoIIIJ protein YidD
MKQLTVFGIIYFLLFSTAGAQQNNESVKNKLIQNTFEQYKFSVYSKRKFISLKNKSLIVKINPINYIGAGLLFFYQKFLSEQIQAKCNYEISCSGFTKLSIEKYGFIKGTLLGFNQLTNCIPAILYDYPEYKISKNSKVINNFEADQ